MLEDFMKSWQDPHMRHAMLVHAPITLSSLGIIPLLWLAIIRFKHGAARWVCVAWFATAALTAFVAAQAGEDAVPSLAASGPPMTPDEGHAVHEHEEAGEIAWIWPSITCVFVALTLVRPRAARITFGVLAIAAGLFSLAAVAYVAHLGGQLVYVHGLGVPTR